MAQNFIENSRLNKKQAENAWKMIYCLLSDVKKKMDCDFEIKKGSIEDKDVYDIKEYIRNSMNRILKNVLGIEGD